MKKYPLWIVVLAAVSCGNESQGGNADQGPGSDTVQDADGSVANETAGQDGMQAGSIRWSFQLASGPGGQEAADQALAVGEDDTVYAMARPFGGGARLYAIGSDGIQKWVFEGLPQEWDVGCAGVVLSNSTNTLYVPCSDHDGDQVVGRVFAVSTAGVLRWTFDLPAGDLPVEAALWSHGTPPVDTLYLTTEIPQPAPTKPLFLYSIESNGQAGPELEGDKGFLGLAVDDASNVYTTTPDGNLLGLDSSLAQKWTLGLSKGTPNGVLAVGPDGALYVGVTAPSGLVAVVFDSTKGNLVEKWFFPSDSAVAQPSFAPDGSILVVDMIRGLLALDPADGTQRWSESGSASSLYQSAVGADGSVYYTLDYALSGRNPQGAEMFVNTSIRSTNPPAIGSDGTVFAAGLCGDASQSNDCIFAIQGSTPPAPGWFRGTGGNGNTRWAGHP
ncbi:MAG: PQQ-like beta-propeller repeat protein [Deltaproteobacteria bacterium]|nr:PQQ-like beta-propeller repeat protein [Deltaproteobacteria bacterium]